MRPARGRSRCWCAPSFSGISAGTEMLAYRGELDPDLPLDETIGALGGTFRYPFRYGYSCVGRRRGEPVRARPRASVVFAFHPHQDRFVARAADVVPLGSVATPARRRCSRSSRRRCRSRSTPGRVLGDTVVVFGLGVVGAADGRAAAAGRRARSSPSSPGPGGGTSRRARRLTGRRARRRAPTRWRTRRPGRCRSGRSRSSGNPDALGDALPACSRTRARRSSRRGTGRRTVTPAARRRVPPPASDDPQHAGLDDPGPPAATAGTRRAGGRGRRRCSASCRSTPGAPHTFPFEQAADAYAAIDAGRRRIDPRRLGVCLDPCSKSARRSSSRPARHARCRGTGGRAPRARLPPRGRRRAGEARRPRAWSATSTCSTPRCRRIDDAVRGQNLEMIRPDDAEAVTVEVFARWAHDFLADALRGTGRRAAGRAGVGVRRRVRWVQRPTRLTTAAGPVVARRLALTRGFAGAADRRPPVPPAHGRGGARLATPRSSSCQRRGCRTRLPRRRRRASSTASRRGRSPPGSLLAPRRAAARRDRSTSHLAASTSGAVRTALQRPLDRPSIGAATC